jgi:hypothetical protein
MAGNASCANAVNPFNSRFYGLKATAFVTSIRLRRSYHD